MWEIWESLVGISYSWISAIVRTRSNRVLASTALIIDRLKMLLLSFSPLLWHWVIFVQTHQSFRIIDARQVACSRWNWWRASLFEFSFINRKRLVNVSAWSRRYRLFDWSFTWINITDGFGLDAGCYSDLRINHASNFVCWKFFCRLC